MRRKPAGRRYRNLYARGGVVYYQRIAKGKRVRFSCETADWDEAATLRDHFEHGRCVAAASPSGAERTSFGDFAQRYLAEATGHLAPSTLEDRKRLLGRGGMLDRALGSLRLGEVTRPTLLEWWTREVEGRGRSTRTGATYLSAISGVFGYAVDLELVTENPVEGLRQTLRRRRRTKRGRAEAALGGHIRPLEAPGDLARFLEASRAAYGVRFGNGRARWQGQAGHIADMLQLDAGLRLGEVAGLRWRDIEWGDGPDDTSRALLIRESMARGRYAGPPKSGRARRVALSRRLRALLREFHIARGRPADPERILPAFSQRNYNVRHFAPTCRAAGLTERHTPKDLRDTFACLLLTAGVQLGYIAQQLGHAAVSTTAQHYARWASRDYRAPLHVQPGEVPADLVARIGTSDEADVTEKTTTGTRS